MDAIISYLIKSGSLLLFFSLVYFLLLRKETFFRTNRFFLVGGLLISIVLPWITFTKIIWKEAVVFPVINVTQPIVMSGPDAIQNESEPINWFLIIGIIYLAGALFFIGQFAFDYYLLRKVLAGKTIRKDGQFRIVQTNDDVSPFSYFKYIVYNPAHYSVTELENILEHEKTHCREYHSLDVLLTRLCCIIFWFNPIVWLYKSQIIQNLEFIADSEANKRIIDRKNYQITLLKVTARENCLAFTNPFYQSLIKKRIVMLNKKQSRKINLWKYSVVLPALVIFMLQFQINVVAQTKGPAPTASATKLSKVEIQVDAASAEKDLNDMVAFFKDEFEATLLFSGYRKDNLNQVIGLKVALTNKDGVTKKYEVSGKTPIDPFTIYINISPQGKEDFGFSTISENTKHSALSTINQESVVDSILVSHTNQKGTHATATAAGLISEKDFGNTSDKTRLLYIINGKDYYPEMVKDLVITTSEYIEQLLPAEGLKRYGEKGRNGVLIFHGISTFDKKETAVPAKVTVPKTVTLENGDEVLFFSNTKMKVPGFASVDFADSTIELFINGVKYYDPGETIEKLDVSRILSIQLVETTNPKTKIAVYSKILMTIK